MMKKTRIYLMALLSCAAFACTQQEEIPFDVKLEGDLIEAEADGGVFKVAVSASGEWTALTGEPWITVSPANGRGSAVCEVKIDSALTADVRNGEVLIEMKDDAGTESKSFEVKQNGYGYSIELNQSEVKVKNYDDLEKRTFDIYVKTNTDFMVVPEENADWLSPKEDKLDLDSGLRPRNVKVTFTWLVNAKQEDRVAKFRIVPKDETVAGIEKTLTVTQQAGDEIEAGTARGDAQAIIAASRALGVVVTSWELSRPLSEWDNVKVWTEEDMDAIKDLVNGDIDRYKADPDFDLDKVCESFVGRVRYVQFYQIRTKEPAPFELSYLTAAEEIVFMANANSFMYNLRSGDNISSLTQLKRLTMMGYGLDSLSESFSKLKNLEMLDLRANNFRKIPDVLLDPQQFPELKALYLGANQRDFVYDLSNAKGQDYGGLVESSSRLGENGGFPEAILKLDKLDTLSLSVNYLYGSIPDCKDWPKYTQQDIDDAVAAAGNAADTIGTAMLEYPKVLPKTRCLQINLNRLSGELPDWLLYHPNLDLWMPEIFIFNQEGTDPKGAAAVFSNAPVSLKDYGYYKVHPYKKPY